MQATLQAGAGRDVLSYHTLKVLADLDPAIAEVTGYTRYRIDDFQETYFVIRNLDELLELARIDFAPIYAAVRGQSELEPGEVLATDRVIHRGTGAYHAAKRRALR